MVGWNLAVLVALLAAVLAAGEIYCRFLLDSTDAFGLTLVSERWFARHYRFNAARVRDDVEYPAAIPPGKRRVTFLGDSFTAGHGIADVGRRFGNLVREAHRTDWDVSVLAMNGYDTGEEVEGLKRMSRTGYALDVVVLVYVLNDISDLLPERGRIEDRIRADHEAEGFLLRNSYFVNLLYYRWKTARDPDLRGYYGFVRRAYDDPAIWSRQEERLRGLAAFCARRSAKLLVVTFPFLGTPRRDYAYREVHAKLDAFWQGLGVPHLDLLPVLEEHGLEKLMISRRDPHPSEAAHRIAADAIIPFIEANLGR